MTRNKTELTYLRAGIQSASSVQLVIILYDLLIGALMGAITAIGKNDVEERCREVKRAFLVLEQMDSSLNTESGGDASKNLARFYAALRSNIMKAHAQVSRPGFERQIQLVFQVRGAWEKVDSQQGPNNSPKPSNPQETQPQEVDLERRELAANWTA
jgi:flagellar secretion chaperone FliS